MIRRALHSLPILSMFTALGLATAPASADPVILKATPAGDCTYAWNSKYGPYGYGVGTNSLGVGLGMAGQYGNDWTISIIQIPLAPITGQTVTSATLQVDSLGFGTGYYYGSARLGWLDTTNLTLTGDPVADGLGPACTGQPFSWAIYDSGAAAGNVADGSPGIKAFDALTCVQADLAAGRAFSTFVMTGSRDTYGEIRSAESGSTGPQLIVTVATPEPASLALLAIGGIGLLTRRKRA